MEHLFAIDHRAAILGSHWPGTVGLAKMLPGLLSGGPNWV